MKYALLLLLFAAVLVLSDGTDCSSHDYVFTVGQPVSGCNCWGGNNNVLMTKPNLPEGLSMVNNEIVGTPLKGQYTHQYLVYPNIRWDDNVVRINISSMPSPSPLTI